MSNSRSKVFRDSIHGLISIDEDRELLLDLINTKEFQRLRRVKQLGVSSLTYPNAEHTRFSHSLGVLHIATRILDTLHRRYHDDRKISSRLTGTEGRQVKVAALLHDLGHGPFSHAMERVFAKTKAHEERSRSMFTDSSSQVLEVLLKHQFSSAEIETTRELLDFHAIQFLHDIISSSLDADRMDYLLRDSHFTGVKYGSFDLEWVINSFCLGGDPSPSSGNSAKTARLCLDLKRGQHAAEQLIVARAHMTMQVYGHSITRLWEALLLMLFAEATKLALEDKLPTETPRHIKEYLQQKGEVSHEQFLLFDEPSLLASMSLWMISEASSPKLKRLSSAFLNREKILAVRELPPIKDYKLRNEQIQRALAEEFGPQAESGWILDCYDFAAYTAPKEAIATIDPDEYWASISENAILLSHGDYNEVATPIQKNSLILETLGSQRMPLTRVYYLKEFEERMARRLQQA